MIDPQSVDPLVLAQIVRTVVESQQAAHGVFNGEINIPTIMSIAAAAFLLYGRIVKIETKMDPIWEWWNALRPAAGAQHNDPDSALLIDRRGKQ